jgi:hypothetical protein
MTKVNYDATQDKNFEDRSKGLAVRNSDEQIEVSGNTVNKISEYSYDIQIRDKAPLVGKLSREEMNLVYQLYSTEGSDASRKEVYRELFKVDPSLTFEDFKRVLRAFNITKACSPFAPHVIEETSVEQLTQLSFQSKENLYLKKVELERGRDTEVRYKELLKKYAALESKTSLLNSSLHFDESEGFNIEVNRGTSKKDTLILHLSDLHIGAKVSTTSLYSNEYNYDVIKARLQHLLDNISQRDYSQIIVNLLGDNIDGMDMMTARKDHLLPQNMDNFEQVTNYITLMKDFFEALYKISKNITVFSVRSGNHDGDFGWIATCYMMCEIQKMFPKIKSTIFDRFFGTYMVGSHRFVICHGKDALFMKRPMPLILTAETNNFIRDWLEDNKIQGDDIHIIKGDLHSDSLTGCKKMGYRNVLSMFGSSDYCQMNYARNNYGVSYELIDSNDNLLRGSYINL